MNKKTNAKFTEYKQNLGAENSAGVDYVNDYEKVERIIEQGIQESAFLRLISTKFIVDSPNQAYEMSLPIVSTTNTEQGERQPKNYIQGNVAFECKQINLDVHLPYSDLDKFATVDFEKALNDTLGAELLQNIVMVGFNGERREADSNPAQNPLGQEVAKGWIKQIKDAGQVLDATAHQGKSANGLIKLALEKLPVKLRESGELVAICGADIMANSFVNIDYSDLQQSAKNNLLAAQNLIGGLKAINVSYFPRNGIFITPLSNLAVYFKKDTSRLFFKNTPEKNTEEVYFSTNPDFLLENHRHAVYIDGLEVGE
ncbi:P2 family phage major capsid protein [Aggregatibacter actinomycetemcomitans]|uniref:P2 family phage major capsid protein n=1 Tax=Aggregatibacter actinomycetemcomitans TaxID=714 RepID=UPI00197BAE59|nr:P2 family phage major capsid protein [Aggregatibacter actinomycetemcomitans]MBN6075909.1 P2 family phage major capsid protein [Aggregatibacter actinomycetemcomitans]